MKVGDRVVIVSGWFRDEYGECVSGVLVSKPEFGHIKLDNPTTCTFEYKELWVVKGDFILESLYNSKLYKVLY